MVEKSVGNSGSSHRKAKKGHSKHGGTDKDRKQNRKRFTTEKDAEGETKYRNRALERSKLQDEYYIRIEQEYQLLKKQTVEESRYMGGDEEHTHMVKGLDYALLRKVKSEIDRERSKIAIVGDGIEEQPRMGHTDLGLYIYKTFFYHTHLHNKNFKQRLDKTYEMILNGYTLKKKGDSFTKYYTYDLKLDQEDNDIPLTTVYNCERDSKAPEEAKETIVNSFKDPGVKRELYEALHWHAENRKRSKEHRLPFRERVEESGQGDDEDIFENVGEYKADEVNLEDGMMERSGKYFSDSDEVEEEPVMPRLAVRRKQAQDAYDECYPENAESDDEGIASKGGKRGKKKSDWNKIEKIIAEKKVIPLEEFEEK